MYETFCNSIPLKLDDGRMKTLIQMCTTVYRKIINHIRAHTTWHDGVVFASGFVCCGIVTFLYVAKINNLTGLQLLGHILKLSLKNSFEFNQEYNTINWHSNTNNKVNQLMPYARTRPSSVSLAMHTQGLGMIFDYSKFKTPIELINNVRQFTSISNTLLESNLPPYMDKQEISFKTVENIRYTEYYYPGASYKNGIIIFLPGSAFVVQPTNNRMNIFKYISHFTGCLMLQINYGVAPEYTINEMVDQCWNCYLEILSKYNVKYIGSGNNNKNSSTGDDYDNNNNNNKEHTYNGLNIPVFLFGESAGGTLLLLMLEKIQHMKNNNNYNIIPYPTGSILSSPVTELTASLPSMKKNVNKSATGLSICYQVAVGIIDKYGNKTDKYNNAKDKNELLEKWSPLSDNKNYKNVKCDFYWIVGLHEDLFDDSKQCVKKIRNEINLYEYNVLSRFNEFIPHGIIMDVPEMIYEFALLCNWINNKTGYNHDA